MKDNFTQSLALLLKEEGGFSNNPKDPGGMTNLGVTKKVWEDFCGHSVDELTMRSLTPERVAPLYKQKYWDTCKCDDLPSGVDYAVFDMAVNSGPARAAKFLQEVVGVRTDGMIGNQTLEAIKMIIPSQIVTEFCEKRLAFLQGLPTWQTFGRGWGNRVLRVEDTAFKMASK